MSQTKPNESGTCLPTEEIKLLIKSNEIGKRDSKKVPLLLDKISILDSSISLLKQKVSIKDQEIDSLVAAAYSNEDKYKGVINNDILIKKSYEESIGILNLQIKGYKKEITRNKFKLFLVGSAGILLSSLIFIYK